MNEKHAADFRQQAALNAATPKPRAGEHTKGPFATSEFRLLHYVNEIEAERDALRAREAELAGALEGIRDELQQANGGKGPSLPLSAHILGIARAALAKHGR